MSAPGFTPIQLYYSTTASAAPSSGNLANGELAINITDGKLYYKDNGGTVRVLAGTGGTGVVAGSNTQVQFNNNGVFGASSGLTFDGTTLTANALTVTNATTLSAGTANGVPYLNASKVLTTGGALTFNGFTLGISGSGLVQSLTSSGDFSTSGTAYLRWYDSGGAKGYIGYAGTASTLTLASSMAGLDLQSNTYVTFSTPTEQMRLTSTGLGIGTSSPVAKLDVVGEALIQGRLQVTSATPEILFSVPSGGLDSRINNDGSGNLIFGTGTNSSTPTERMRLDAFGNLGLGVTPSAWFANSKVFQFGTGGSLEGRDNNPLSAFASNSYIDTSGNYKYITTNFASRYYQTNGQHIWQTSSSGTAGNAISFTQAMTLDASGRLGIGTTSPSQLLHVSGNSPRIYLSDVSAGSPIIDIGSGGGSFYIGSDNSTGSAFSTSAYARLLWGVGAYPMVFATNNTERARIDSSGNLLVGTTSASGSNSGSFYFVPGTGSFAGVAVIQHSTSNVSGSGYINFNYNGSAIGSISQSGTTAVLYNVTSDQRLKENIADADSASALIDSLQVRKYDWKADGSHQRYGFIAQELVTVAPEAVHQPADPEEMMAVDYSKLVPMLVKEIQSLRKRISALEAK